MAIETTKTEVELLKVTYTTGYGLGYFGLYQIVAYSLNSEYDSSKG